MNKVTNNKEEVVMVNLANLLDLISGGEPLEVIDKDTMSCIDPKKGQTFIYPFEQYEVLSMYSGINQYKESYICMEVRRWNNVKC